jgi:adenosylcobinamide-phosphate guanylyltransferase
MGVTALVMAGGKGTRMKTMEEKPLLKVGGKPIIEYILNALRAAKKVDEIIVATSERAPKTATMAKKLSMRVLNTSGRGFVPDIQCAIKKLGLSTVLTISADLPLIKSEFIDRIIERYEECGKPALTVAVQMETRERLGLSSDYAFEVNGKRLVPAGINVIDGKRIDEKELEEEVFVLDDERVALNVNTLEDLRVAELMLQPRSR